MIRTLQEHPPEVPAQTLEEYEALCARRRQAFRAHVAAMAPSLTIAGWTIAMVKKHGAKAVAHFNVVSWPVALMIGRYGEAIGYWPSAFSEDDLVRAQEWLRQGKFALGIAPLTEELIGDRLEKNIPLHGLDEEG